MVNFGTLKTNRSCRRSDRPKRSIITTTDDDDDDDSTRFGMSSYLGGQKLQRGTDRVTDRFIRGGFE